MFIISFVDLFLCLPKRKHFNPFVCAEICDQATTESYSKTSKIISNKIEKRTSNDINFNQATRKNIVLAFNPKYNEINNLKINANKIIFPTDTKTNKYFNNFYNTGFETFDYIQKEETSFI